MREGFIYLGESFTPSVTMQFRIHPILGSEQTKEEGPDLFTRREFLIRKRKEHQESGAGDCRGEYPGLSLASNTVIF